MPEKTTALFPEMGKGRRKYDPVSCSGLFALGCCVKRGRFWLFPAFGQHAGNSITAVILLAFAGMLFVIPTAAEIPIVQTMMAFGLGTGGQRTACDASGRQPSFLNHGWPVVFKTNPSVCCRLLCCGRHCGRVMWNVFLTKRLPGAFEQNGAARWPRRFVFIP